MLKNIEYFCTSVMAEEEDPWAEYREQLSRRADHYAHPGQTFLNRPVSARPLAASRSVGRPIRRPSKRAELLAKSREEAALAAATPDRAAVVASPGSAARLRYHNASRLGRTGRRYRNHNNDPKIDEGVREFVRVMARGIKVYKYARNGVCSERILYLAENSVVWAKAEIHAGQRCRCRIFTALGKVHHLPYFETTL